MTTRQYLRKKLRKLEALTSESSEENTSEYEEMNCVACKRDVDADQLLLCDGCDLEGAHHTYCLRPPLDDIPEGKWFCPACVDSRSKADKKKGVTETRRNSKHRKNTSSEFVRVHILEEEEQHEDDKAQKPKKERKGALNARRESSASPKTAKRKSARLHNSTGKGNSLKRVKKELANRTRKARSSKRAGLSKAHKKRSAKRKRLRSFADEQKEEEGKAEIIVKVEGDHKGDLQMEENEESEGYSSGDVFSSSVSGDEGEQEEQSPDGKGPPLTRHSVRRRSHHQAKGVYKKSDKRERKEIGNGRCDNNNQGNEKGDDVDAESSDQQCQEEEASSDKDSTSEDPIVKNLECECCGRGDDEENMLLCDGKDCNTGYHIYCIFPPLDTIPKGDWFCDQCSMFLNEESSDENRTSCGATKEHTDSVKQQPYEQQKQQEAAPNGKEQSGISYASKILLSSSLNSGETDYDPFGIEPSASPVFPKLSGTSSDTFSGFESYSTDMKRRGVASHKEVETSLTKPTVVQTPEELHIVQDFLKAQQQVRSAPRISLISKRGQSKTAASSLLSSSGSAKPSSVSGAASNSLASVGVGGHHSTSIGSISSAVSSPGASNGQKKAPELKKTVILWKGPLSVSGKAIGNVFLSVRGGDAQIQKTKEMKRQWPPRLRLKQCYLTPSFGVPKERPHHEAIILPEAPKKNSGYVDLAAMLEREGWMAAASFPRSTLYIFPAAQFERLFSSQHEGGRTSPVSSVHATSPAAARRNSSSGNCLLKGVIVENSKHAQQQRSGAVVVPEVRFLGGVRVALVGYPAEAKRDRSISALLNFVVNSGGAVLVENPAVDNVDLLVVNASFVHKLVSLPYVLDCKLDPQVTFVRGLQFLDLCCKERGFVVPNEKQALFPSGGGIILLERSVLLSTTEGGITSTSVAVRVCELVARRPQWRVKITQGALDWLSQCSSSNAAAKLALEQMRMYISEERIAIVTAEEESRQREDVLPRIVRTAVKMSYLYMSSMRHMVLLTNENKLRNMAQTQGLLCMPFKDLSAFFDDQERRKLRRHSADDRGSVDDHSTLTHSGRKNDKAENADKIPKGISSDSEQASINSATVAKAASEPPIREFDDGALLLPELASVGNTSSNNTHSPSMLSLSSS